MKQLLSVANLNRHQSAISFGVMAVIFVWLYSRVGGVLPAIMQDEYVYSMQARKLPLAELEYPNYLFSWVYSGTDVCGLSYYSCTKSLNLVFFAGFVAVLYFVAAALIGRWWALAVAAGTALSPVGVYTSVFMPESMYFFFAAASLAGLWVAARRDVWWQLGLAGFVLGLTALVKPHALFLAIAAVLYLLTVNWPRFKEFGIAAGYYLAGLFVAKFGLGFVLAGPAGLTLFGSSYTSSFNSFTENLGSGRGESLVAGGAALADGADAPTGVFGFLSESIYQLAWQTSAVLLIAGALIALSAAPLLAPKAERAEIDRPTLRFAQLSLISLGVMVGVISAFAAMVTLLGDDHSVRLLMRYYEFLVPLLAIAAIAVLKQNPQLARSWRTLAALGAALLIALLGVALWLGQLNQQFSDSPFMMGLTSSDFMQGFAVAMLLAAAAMVFLNAKAALAGFAAVSLIAIAGFGVASQQRLINLAGTPSTIDYAGYFARDFLADESGESVLFIGTNKQLVEASIFAMDKPNVEFRLLGPGQFFDTADAAGKNWIVAISETQIRGREQYRIIGNGFIVSRIAPEREHFFAQQMIDTPIESVRGLGDLTSWGAWADGTQGELLIRFSELLPQNASISMTILPSAATANQQLTLRVGDSEGQVQLGEAGRGVSVDLSFSNSLPSGELAITLPADPQALGLVSLRVND